MGSLASGVYLTRSTDGGATWGPTGGVFIVANNQGAFVCVGPDHSVYVFWYDSAISPRRIMVRNPRTSA